MQSLEALFEKRIAEITGQILAYPIEDRESYCRFLNQQYYLVQNSTRYLALSASKIGPTQRKEFREWAHHLSEELDHDMLVLADLKRLDYEPRDEMSPYARALIGYQYDSIETKGHNAILGYALLLEGLSCHVCKKLADRVEVVMGKGAATYLRLHADVDLEHFPEGMKKIRELNAEQTEIVRDNLEVSAALYSSLLNWLTETMQPTLPTVTSHQHLQA
jgi:hypothetical protein